MPLLNRWNEDGGIFGIWQIMETPEELRHLLIAFFPYDEELDKYKAPSRKLEYLGVRVLLKSLIGEEKLIGHSLSGKPFLVDGSYRISISHTRGYVALALHPEREVGIDIEQVSDRVRKVSDRFIRTDENAPDTLNMLLHWSAKETMYKMMEVEEVDFKEHLQILPYDLSDEGRFFGNEFRTGRRLHFEIRYFVHPDFVCTWCIGH
ncbi:4'-phosphopantetheinyl transferase superfamily protein [uncultured Bacteroides sp.]|uniref:4'-phosphopantetheinyl transferase superfamily protein n=1 Tax=uncultured Bacteroides sp. TaxID=162156 RepID=UPI0026054E41|nr:4'-phosphopantetheinyl transferase superfamily protein [uncultured Bacteroides sp.]